MFRWCDEDPLEILQSVNVCIEKSVENLKKLNIDPSSIKGELPAADYKFGLVLIKGHLIKQCIKQDFAWFFCS